MFQSIKAWKISLISGMTCFANLLCKKDQKILAFIQLKRAGMEDVLTAEMGLFLQINCPDRTL